MLLLISQEIMTGTGLRKEQDLESHDTGNSSLAVHLLTVCFEMRKIYKQLIIRNKKINYQNWER